MQSFKKLTSFISTIAARVSRFGNHTGFIVANV